MTDLLKKLSVQGQDYSTYNRAAAMVAVAQQLQDYSQNPSDHEPLNNEQLYAQYQFLIDGARECTDALLSAINLAQAAELRIETLEKTGSGGAA